MRAVVLGSGPVVADDGAGVAKNYGPVTPTAYEGMGIIHEVLRWYKLKRGRGREMRASGAVVATCPHCERDTPVFATEYDTHGDPLSFSVCVWCEGFIEYDGTTATAHEPYATLEEIQGVSLLL